MMCCVLLFALRLAATRYEYAVCASASWHSVHGQEERGASVSWQPFLHACRASFLLGRRPDDNTMVSLLFFFAEAGRQNDDVSIETAARYMIRAPWQKVD
jgi:hypothetical protein